ncbi:MAG: hypothetical protein FWE14_01690 [Lachnospiraceae bacterium]|nr:hypothetical protein [Lachnospiraceae bacterium]
MSKKGNEFIEKKKIVITGTMVCCAVSAIGIIVTLVSMVIYTARGDGTPVSFLFDEPTIVIGFSVSIIMFFVTLSMLRKKK